MAVFDLFSKQQKRLRGEITDMYVYDNLSKEFRVQVEYIIGEALYTGFNAIANDIYGEIVHSLCREFGVYRLVDNLPFNLQNDYREELLRFIGQEKDHEKILSAIQLVMIKHGRPDLIAELNARFQENGIGYRFEDGQIIRIDSELIHTEIIKPALLFLNKEGFEGPKEEFLQAHSYYRDGNSKETIQYANKSFESTLKAICDKQKWAYDKNKDTAKSLLKICKDNMLFPEWAENHLNALIDLLTGMPTTRNKLAGHGQGSEPIKVPECFAKYALNMAASAIVLLSELAEL